MSSIEILIRGEEAEAFAQKLLAIEGISPKDESYKGQVRETIMVMEE